jgi:hypothetical protein
MKLMFNRVSIKKTDYTEQKQISQIFSVKSDKICEIRVQFLPYILHFLARFQGQRTFFLPFFSSSPL